MVLSSRSGLIAGHVFHQQPARLSSCWEGRMPELAGWLGLVALTQALVSTLSSQQPASCKGSHVFKVRVVGSLEVLSLGSRLFGESYVKGQG